MFQRNQFLYQKSLEIIYHNISVIFRYLTIYYLRKNFKMEEDDSIELLAIRRRHSDFQDQLRSQPQHLPKNLVPPIGFEPTLFRF